MSQPSPSELRNLLTFLREVGYGEVYVPVEKVGVARQDRPSSRESAQRPSASQRPPAQGGPQRPPTQRPSAQRPPAQQQPAQRPPAQQQPAQRPPAQQQPAQATVRDASSPQVRWERLDDLRQHAMGCTKCALSKTRNKVVFASGDPDAELMLIGEGPGADEDRQGIPFVGEAGRLLNKIIAAIDMQREGVYVANVVKCRPPENRNPFPIEVQECRGFLDRQIDLVQPKLIVLLGKVASDALLGQHNTLKEMRGTWHRYRDIPVRVTYHPAALLRNRAFKRPTWEDMQIVRDELQRLRAER